MGQGVYQSPSGVLFGFIVTPQGNGHQIFQMPVSGKEEFLRLLLDENMSQEKRSKILRMIDDDYQALLKKRTAQASPPAVETSGEKKSPPKK